MTLSISWPGQKDNTEAWLKVDRRSVLVELAFVSDEDVRFEARLSERLIPSPPLPAVGTVGDERSPRTQRAFVELSPLQVRFLPQTLHVSVWSAQNALQAEASIQIYSGTGHRVALFAWACSLLLAVIVGVRVLGLPWRPVAGVATGATSFSLGAYGWDLLKSQWRTKPTPWVGLAVFASMIVLLLACQSWVYTIHNRTGRKLELQGGLLLAPTQLEFGSAVTWLLFGTPTEALKRDLPEGGELVCFGSDCSGKLPVPPPGSVWEKPLAIYCHRPVALAEAVASDSPHDCTPSTFVSYDGGALDQCCPTVPDYAGSATGAMKGGGSSVDAAGMPTAGVSNGGAAAASVDPLPGAPSSNTSGAPALAARCCAAGPDQGACVERIGHAKAHNHTKAPYTLRARNDQSLGCNFLTGRLQVRNEAQFDVSVIAVFGPDVEEEILIPKNSSGLLRFPNGALPAGVELRVLRPGVPGQPARELGVLSCFSRESLPVGALLLPFNQGGLLAYRYRDAATTRSVWTPTPREELDRVLGICAQEHVREANYEAVLNSNFWATPDWSLPLPIGTQVHTTLFRGEERWGKASCSANSAQRSSLVPAEVAVAGLLSPRTKVNFDSATSNAVWEQSAKSAEPAWLWACTSGEKWRDGMMLFRDGEAVAVWEATAFGSLKVKTTPCFVWDEEVQEDSAKITVMKVHPKGAACRGLEAFTSGLRQHLQAHSCDLQATESCNRSNTL